MSSPTAAGAGSTSPPARRGNPLAFLGLRRVGQEDDEDEEAAKPRLPGSPSKGGVELNRRGLPARKRKRNSLIYGTDDLVSIPVKSPRKKGSAPATPKRNSNVKRAPAESDGEDGPTPEEDEDGGRRTPSPPPKSPAARKTRQTGCSTPDGRRSEPKSPTKRSSPTKGISRIRTPTKSAKKKTATVPASSEARRAEDLELTSPEKKAAQSLGVALRNLLKLPKAHKWVCFEFFYSNIDRVLFEGENDFMVCLRESFPQLRTRRLTRVEWCKVRRLMGKPRRCSAAFFAEERAELTRKRHKIRMLQQRKQSDVTNFKDLPEDIPLQLTIGSRVTARLRKPQDGIFTGTVDAYDTSNNTYRITFDRVGLGTHSIPDDEVLSTDDPETMPLASFTAKARPRPNPQQMQAAASASTASSNAASPYHMSPLKYGSVYSPQLASDPLLSGNTPRGKTMRLDGHLGGYPVKFLDLIVRLSKCLRLKREKVNALKDLNSTGERRKSFGDFIHEDFQRKYAATVLDLSQVNRDLNEYLKDIKEYTQEFSSEAGPTISLPNIVRENCQEDAYNLVNKSNTAKSSDNSEERECVENPKILALISSLTALMMQVKQLADGGRSAFELQALQEAIREIKLNVSQQNRGKFEDCVEVHMQHIQSGLSQMGNLHAFTIPPPSAQPLQLQLVKSEAQGGSRGSRR